MMIFRVAFQRGDNALTLLDGAKLGGLHVAWNNKEHVRPVSKDYDLRSAYRQLPLHPEEQLKAILLLKNPSSGDVNVPSEVLQSLSA